MTQRPLAEDATVVLPATDARSTASPQPAAAAARDAAPTTGRETARGPGRDAGRDAARGAGRDAGRDADATVELPAADGGPITEELAAPVTEPRNPMISEAPGVPEPAADDASPLPGAPALPEAPALDEAPSLDDSGSASAGEGHELAEPALASGGSAPTLSGRTSSREVRASQPAGGAPRSQPADSRTVFEVVSASTVRHGPHIRSLLRSLAGGFARALFTDWTLTGPTILSWPVRSRRNAGIAGVIVLTLLQIWNSVYDLMPFGYAVLLGAMMCLPLLLLPAGPLVAWRLVTIAAVLTCTVLHDTTPFHPALFAVYGATLVLTAMRVRGVETVAVWFTSSLVFTLVEVGIYGGGWADWGMCLFVTIAIGLLCLAGYALHARRHAQAQSTEILAFAQAEEERGAVLLERARIARELHDIVTHHMSAIAVQAQAAPLRDPELSDGSRAAFGAIESTARQALTDLRAVIGVLREDGAVLPREPQPTLRELPGLLARTRESGQHVDYVIDLQGPVPEPVSIAAYRIVQESLTNALRHAPGAPVTVTVALEDDTLIVAIRNPIDTEELGVPGNGTRGMRERTEALGGQLTFAAADGTYTVHAVLPVPAEAA